jgi:hypothetical protein
VDLTHLYEIALHESDYHTLPKLGEFFSITMMIHQSLTIYLDQHNKDSQREMVDLVNFHLRQLAMCEIAPLLEGFCGDFVRGVEQLEMAGTTQTPSKTEKTSEY